MKSPDFLLAKVLEAPHQIYTVEECKEISRIEDVIDRCVDLSNKEYRFLQQMNKKLKESKL